LIGFLCTLIHVFCFFTLVSILSINVFIGNSFSFVVAFTIGHYLNSRFCFKSKVSLTNTFLRYFIVAISGLVLNTLIIYVVVGWINCNNYVGLLLAICFVPPFTFWVNKVWTFR
jgi:putative flippase GtrA